MSTVCLSNPERIAITHIQVRFGQVLREARRSRGWSQEVLADIANLNRSYIGEIERGSVIASIVTLHKLAEALELPASSLLARCESATK
ncbi:MAG TPA: helix-turn-helix transcriptional regulator [Dongiaceae bacterium]|nr:helix-turn-helix transcriptional regulator [Dongiaceae bacterium]